MIWGKMISQEILIMHISLLPNNFASKTYVTSNKFPPYLSYPYQYPEAN